MMASPIIFISHSSRDGGVPNGSTAITGSTACGARNRLSVPPTAIRLVEAKKAVPFCKAAETWASTMRPLRPSMCAIHSSR